MRAYLDLLQDILHNGTFKADRTGVGTRSVFGRQFRHDLSKGFPLLTTKRLYTKSIVHELLWFLRGDTDVQYLRDNDVHIWDAWADASGKLGPIYGAQWRGFGTGKTQVDQIAQVIDLIRKDPDSRRMIVTAWNPLQVSKMALPPCHLLFQFYVSGGKLSCHLYMRSADVFLGVPFNIASYALLTHMVAQVTGLEVGDLVVSFGDLHLYSNHVNQAELQLGRDPHPLPRLVLDPKVEEIDDFRFEHVTFEGYQHHAPISAPVAV